jgi:ribonuclease HI
MSEHQHLPQAYIYTDGACLGNPGPGGWAAVLLENGDRREISGGKAGTTNNRMELMACIQGLQALRRPTKVTVVTDSRYLHDALTKGWLRKWRSNGWKTSARTPVKNRDLWEELLPLLQRHQVSLKWTPGHQGQPENERCDALAKAAALGEDLPVDIGE